MRNWERMAGLLSEPGFTGFVDFQERVCSIKVPLIKFAELKLLKYRCNQTEKKRVEIQSWASVNPENPGSGNGEAQDTLYNKRHSYMIKTLHNLQKRKI